MKLDDFTKDFSHSPVPNTHLRGVVSLIAVFIAFAVNIASLIFGMEVSAKAPFPLIVMGALGGGVLLAMIASFTAIIGAKTRLSTAMIAKFTFGQKGGNIVSLVFAFSLFGWFGVQTELFADSLGEMIKMFFSYDLPRFLLIIFGGVLMSSTAIIGYKALEKLSLVSAPLLLALILWPLLLLVRQGQFPDLSGDNVETIMPLGTIIALTAGGWMAGAVVMPDIMRYARSRLAALTTVWLGFGFFYPFLIFLAAILGIHSGESDFIPVLLALNLGIPALFVLILATWTTNDSNLYTASLSLSAIFQKIPKWKLAAFAGGLGTLVAMFGILDNFIPWLIALGVVIAPIGGVIIGDYLLNRRNYNVEHLQDMPIYKVKEILIWLAGCALGFMTAPKDIRGLEIFTITQIPPLDALLFALIVTLLIGNRFVTRQS